MRTQPISQPLCHFEKRFSVDIAAFRAGRERAAKHYDTVCVSQLAARAKRGRAILCAADLTLSADII
jgi:hypothetical protein